MSPMLPAAFGGSSRRDPLYYYYMPLAAAELTFEKVRPSFWSILKGLYMVGFTLLSRSYYFLRKRSPGPRSRPTTVTGRGTRGAIMHRGSGR